MYSIVKNIHSGLAIVLLLITLVATVYAICCWIAQKPYTTRSKTIALTGLITAHTQLLMGLIIYWVSPVGMANFSRQSMGNSIARLYILEHPVMMVLAVILITTGYTRSKRAKTDIQKFRLLGIFYAIGLLLMLSRLPYHVWM